MKTTKFMCEMTTAEQITAHEENLAAQRALLPRAGEYAPAVERWIAESEAALARLRG